MATHERRLTFPQRNWLLLCFLTAIIVALAFYIVDKSSRHHSREGQVQTTSGPTSVPNGGDTSHTQGIPPDSLKH
jgi:hypothetical protein